MVMTPPRRRGASIAGSCGSGGQPGRKRGGGNWSSKRGASFYNYAMYMYTYAIFIHMCVFEIMYIYIYVLKQTRGGWLPAPLLKV